MAASEPVLQNGIPGTPSVALSTADGSSEFARPPSNRGDVLSLDGILIQGGSGCNSDTRTHPRRIRVRDEKMCPANFLQLSGEEGSKQNTGGNGDPKPPVMIPPKDSKLPYLSYRKKIDQKKIRSFVLKSCIPSPPAVDQAMHTLPHIPTLMN